MKGNHKTVKSPPIEKIWFEQQFNQIDNANAIILVRLDELKTLVLAVLNRLDDQPSTVIPALEAAVNAVSTQAIKIDQQVPDINLPPGKTNQ